MEELREMSTGVLAAIAILATVQFAVVVWALVDMAKRPVERLRWGSKAIWAAIIVLLMNSFIGPIVYFAFGRLPAEAKEGDTTSIGSDRTQRAVDSLYGERDS